ncbi:transglutaminase domain-containing protein [Natronomonas amylolytica]|uniref:transglutaminase family protein n=1 Tax=Natronomonas amylolytica TaxID=3108498 RepID=UPI0030094494
MEGDRRPSMWVILAACCLVGLVLGGALAPAAGIQTPIPDLGVEGEGVDDADAGEGDEPGSGDGDLGANGSGVSNYGGVSAGGYPERATVGGRLELADRPALVVESPEPARWRLGAYATYTGDGWESGSDSRVPLSSPVSAVSADQPAYEIDVRARRSFRSLATVNRPAFAATNERQVFVDEERAFTVDEPIRAGETYTTLTYGEASPASAAVASDGDYPADIEARYTRLPEDTPDRLGNRTAEITADAGTPYESAVAVERWLEATKAYSLNATHDREADVATEFVFEMEAGYCQYFATSMVAMLRTQGIPARYVTGYSPGDRVGDDEYRVSEANAHAWVEVYIADVGWVTFDPTPAEGRVEAGRDPASLDELGDDWDATTDEENATDALTRADEPGGSISVTLTDDPVPGRPTTAVVTRNGTPVTRADVLFNGERVGGTSRGGSVTGIVPYAETLSVEVRIRADPSQLNRDELDATVAYSAGIQTDGNPIVEFPLHTTAAIDPLGDPTPGESIEVVATVQGDPIPAADVSVDGQRVATTDDRGSATVELPDAESADIVVERGGVSGDRTIPLQSNESSDDGSGPLSVSVTPEGPAPLPYAPATVRVEYENEPVGNATVTVDGDAVAETGADGTATVRLPLSDPVTVTAAAPEGYVSDSEENPLGETASADLGGARLTGTARIGSLYRNTMGVLGIGIGIVGGLVGLGRRRDIRARRLLADRDRLLADTSQSVLGVVVGTGAAVDSTLPALRRRVEAGLALLTDGTEGISTLGAALAAALRRGLRRIDPRALLAALRGEDTANRAAGDTARQPTVREAWTELRDHTTVPSWATSTPGEIARWAVERDGLPEDAVATLLSAFREVEYGDRPPEERAAAIEAAIERIRETTTATDDGGADP